MEIKYQIKYLVQLSIWYLMERYLIFGNFKYKHKVSKSMRAGILALYNCR